MEISNFIKYCMGYVRLTQQRTFVSQQKFSLELSEDYFKLEGLLNGDLDDELGELINLDLFYSLDPKEVTKEQEKQYRKEKALANQIEEIYNKYKNDQFTKQIVFSFGYFEIEIPIEEELKSEEELEIEENGAIEPRTKIDRFPLFSVPINIEKERGKYLIYFVDPEIQVNISFLENILEEDLYYQLVEEISEFELEGKLSLPLENSKVFNEVWRIIKEKLRLKEARFDDESFQLEEMRISLSPRANYFLAEDLQKLSKLEEKDLEGTSLTSWVDDTDLNIEGSVPEETELFFPFLYDKYQVKTLSLLRNKASIIQGPPGTGKSETIANMLSHLAATGNRVLFVSQKAQALKVVKDKLKQTGIKYLFGYLPNPASAQLGEEDEIDGIAPQLSALSSHVEKLGYKYNARKKLLEYDGIEDHEEPVQLDKVVDYKFKVREAFQDTLEFEREIFQLNKKIEALKQYDVPISEVEDFKDNFTQELFLEIEKLREDIITYNKAALKYSKNPRKKEFDNLLANINFQSSNFSELLAFVKTDVTKTGYDRHSNLMRKANNLLRNRRLSKVRSNLPREIIDIIDSCLEEDISRIQQVELLDALYGHAIHYENTDYLQKTKDQLQESLDLCGLTEKELQNIIDLHISKSDFSETLHNILKLAELKDKLSDLKEQSKDLNLLASNLKKTSVKQREEIIKYIQNIINGRILTQWKQGITLRQIIQKLAKAFGKSKKAYKTFDNLRKDPDNFNAIRDLIPVWIMELDDASRIIPLEAGVFDYVILDEASQCNIAYTLPVMFRAKHTLFVGDSEQMRDNTVMFKSNRAFDELAHRYKIPEEMQIKATGNAVQSVLEIAGLRGLTSTPLHYHYRSPRELIGFSNQYFYRPKGKDLIALNNTYLTYKDTERVMLNHLVESDWSNEISEKVNVAETEAIFKLFKELREDERYKNKSVGILTFFNAQATFIREYFEAEGLKEEKDNYKVSIIEGIQGDEKDIIIYSFVIRDITQKNKYIALTGESGDIRADINKGRVNVAFSRARLQVHCFYSIPKMPEGIWLKKYIEYVEENGKVDFYSTEIQPFDSYFEEEFYSIAKDSLPRFKIQNQVESCGFKLDFVISDPESGKKIAVECDGPCHFKDEIDQEYGIYIDGDEERQRVLEAAGWNFYRIKYSDWISEGYDKKSAIKDIQRLLN